MFKRIQKIERKKRLIFLSILLPILAVVCLVPVYETLDSLPTRDVVLISYFYVFLFETIETFDDLHDEIKKGRIKND